MKATDLRIGNYVNRIGSITNITAIEYHKDLSYVCTPISGSITENQIEPIQLTEEWLIKFGFKRNERIGSFDTYIVLMKESLSVNNKMGMYFKNQRVPNNIKYVHQLQNLYYALTGEELTIKEK